MSHTIRYRTRNVIDEVGTLSVIRLLVEQEYAVDMKRSKYSVVKPQLRGAWHTPNESRTYNDVLHMTFADDGTRKNLAGYELVCTKNSGIVVFLAQDRHRLYGEEKAVRLSITASSNIMQDATSTLEKIAAMYGVKKVST